MTDSTLNSVAAIVGKILAGALVVALLGAAALVLFSIIGGLTGALITAGFNIVVGTSVTPELGALAGALIATIGGTSVAAE